ncbi:hypothetical protein N5D52_10065 [Pseudomonas sp. GD03860]|uniref:hypothetical protein n=1 Tax=Pseudomonas TaxID=286 RepID=UPI002363F133|nr:MULTISPECIES: hypothetical protein [Pseudomonas]MDD2056344.1 hypothetical protein [Pseudomonas putida]MDH0637287.1 hypothetical protein [Pseudomonas sp. GD03860]
MIEPKAEAILARIKANYIADRACLPTALLSALLGLDESPRCALVGLLASLTRTPAEQLSYDIGLVHGHIFAALQREELSPADTDALLAFVRELTV